MKTTILIHENDQWVYYPEKINKISHISGRTLGECFFFDPVKSSITAVMKQRATDDDPRAGNLTISLKLDEGDSYWFLDKPSRIKGAKEWLKNISRDNAKRYALESLPLPKEEIEEKANEFDAKEDSLNQADEKADKKILLQFMTAIIAIKTVNPKIFAIARSQRDDLIIKLIKYLPKIFKEFEIPMPWSSGLDLGKINITNEDELPEISTPPMYMITETSKRLRTKFPEQFAAAKVFYEDKRWADEDLKLSDILMLSKFILILCKFVLESGKNTESLKILDFYKFSEDLFSESDTIKLTDILSSDLNFYSLYNIKPETTDVLDFYKFCKDFIKRYDNVEVADVLNLNFYKLYKVASSLSDVVDFYGFYKSDKNPKPIDVLNLNSYIFYNENKTLIPSIYKAVNGSGKENINPSDINSDFLGFYGKNKGHDPNDIWKLYKFQKGVKEYQNLEWGRLSSLFDFCEKLDVQDGLTHDVLIKLHDFYKKELDPTVDPQNILSFYNQYKDFLEPEKILNKRFYNFHENVFQQCGRKPHVVLALYKAFDKITTAGNSINIAEILNLYKLYQKAQSTDDFKVKVDDILILYNFKTAQETAADLRLNEDEIVALYIAKIKGYDADAFKKREKNDDFVKFCNLVTKYLKNSNLDAKGLKEYDVVILYKFYKTVCAVENEKFGPDDIFKLHKLYKALAEGEAAKDRLFLSDVFNSYRLFKNVDSYDSDVKVFYNFYISQKNINQQQNLKPGDVKNLSECCMVLAKQERNFEKSEVFNSDFYKLYKEVIPADKNLKSSDDIKALYTFYKVVVLQNKDNACLSDFYKFCKKVVFKSDISIDEPLANFTDNYKLSNVLTPKLFAVYSEFQNNQNQKDHFVEEIRSLLNGVGKEQMTFEKFVNIFPLKQFILGLVIILLCGISFSAGFYTGRMIKHGVNTNREEELTDEDIDEDSNINEDSDDDTSDDDAIAENTAAATDTELQWSSPKTNQELNWTDAKKYCETLKEDGNSDWRLPDIDELQTLIQNCDKSVSCKVDKNCLKNACFNKDECHCVREETGKYSRLKDKGYFWSSSESENEQNKQRAWGVNFFWGGPQSYEKSGKWNVRCVRGGLTIQNTKDQDKQ